MASMQHGGRAHYGKYVVQRVLAANDAGVIALANHNGRAVRLYVVEARRGYDARVDALLAHARAAERLRSKYAARVFDAGVFDDGAPYVATEYEGGVPLAAYLRSRAAPTLDEAVAAVANAAEAVAEAHALGLAHAHIRPDTVTFASSSCDARAIKILGFGVPDLADLASDAEPRPGACAYQAPEQLRADDADGRADVWALGVLLFELLAGRPPFCAPTPVALAARAASAPAEPLRALRSDAPETLAALVERCLAKKPAARPSAVDLRRNLARVLRTLRPDGAPPAPPPRRAVAAARRPDALVDAEPTPDEPDDTAPARDARPPTSPRTPIAELSRARGSDAGASSTDACSAARRPTPDASMDRAIASAAGAAHEASPPLEAHALASPPEGSAPASAPASSPPPTPRAPTTAADERATITMRTPSTPIEDARTTANAPGLPSCEALLAPASDGALRTTSDAIVAGHDATPPPSAPTAAYPAAPSDAGATNGEPTLAARVPDPPAATAPSTAASAPAAPTRFPLEGAPTGATTAFVAHANGAERHDASYVASSPPLANVVESTPPVTGPADADEAAWAQATRSSRRKARVILGGAGAAALGVVALAAALRAGGGHRPRPDGPPRATLEPSAGALTARSATSASAVLARDEREPSPAPRAAGSAFGAASADATGARKPRPDSKSPAKGARGSKRAPTPQRR